MGEGLPGKVAVVTGAGRGIGAATARIGPATARALTREGAAVAIAEKNIGTGLAPSPTNLFDPGV